MHRIKSVVVDDFFPEEEIATALQNSTMAYQLATGKDLTIVHVTSST